MAEARVEAQLRRPARRAEALGQAHRVERPDRPVGRAVQQQHRRRAGERGIRRRGVQAPARRGREGLGQRFLLRRPVERARQGDAAGQRVSPAGQVRRAQPARVERQGGGVVGAGRVAHHEAGAGRRRRAGGPPLPAAQPRHGEGVVLQEGGPAHFGKQAVVRNRHGNAARRQRLGQEDVGRPAPSPPIAAMDEDHERRRRPRLRSGLGRQVEIEAVPRPRSVQVGRRSACSRLVSARSPGRPRRSRRRPPAGMPSPASARRRIAPSREPQTNRPRRKPRAGRGVHLRGRSARWMGATL